MDKGLRTEEIIIDGDEDIAIQVWECLQRQHLPTLDNLDISFKLGELTLRGTVASFYEKQIAMSACKNIPGVEIFIDQISVTN